MNAPSSISAALSLLRAPRALAMASALRDAARKHGGPTGLALKMLGIWREYGTTGVLARIRKQVRTSAITPILPRPDRVLYEPSAAERAHRPDGTLGVMAHVFYPELAPELARFLANIPWPFTLLVSTTSEHHRPAIEAAFARLRTVAQLDLRVVPNRGRDLAPLLVAFADEIRRLDYVCHVHTKKSLHSGGEQVGWREHLCRGVLGSEERIRAILAQFRRDPTVGIVYPGPYPKFPYWGYTWLANRAIAAELLPRLGIELQEGGYLDYAAGSMFWARTRALTPLLDLGLRFEDFPEECGQTDGTLHHALERCFVVAARREGFDGRIVESDLTRHVFDSIDHKNLHQYLDAPIADRIVAASADAKVVSFDVFDTLLVRPFGVPDSVFRLLEQRIGREHGITAFMAKRKAAEHELRIARPSGDIRIRDVYAALARRHGLDDATAAACLRAELEAERDLLRPRPEVVRAGRRIAAAGKRVVLVSDMYLEARDVEAILAANGVDFHQALYLSSEVGARKDRGDLWEHVLRAEAVSKEQLLHVGDNERSDVQILVDLRVRPPVHVMRPLALFELTPEGRALLGGTRPRRWEDDLWVGLIAKRLTLHVDRTPADAMAGQLLADPERFGYAVLGPILFDFLAWLLGRAASDGVRTLEYMSREGWGLRRLHDHIASHPRLRRGLPAARYLYCSRRAAAFAAMRSPAELSLLTSGGFHGSVEEFLRARFALSDPAAVRVALGPSALRARITLPVERARLEALLAPAAPLLVAEGAREREPYEAYLAGRLDDESALVDLGYSGTIQHALQLLLRRPLAAYYFATHPGIRKVEAAGGRAEARYASRADPETCTAPVLRQSLLLEAVLTAPDGQLIRFDRDGRPEFKELGEAQRHFGDVERVHAGAFSFADDLLDALGDDALDLRFDPDLVQRPLRLVAERRWGIGPVERILRVEDDYYGNGEIPVVETLFQHAAAERAAAPPDRRRGAA